MKSVEKELAWRQEMRMDAVSSLAGGLAHELNNALACIIGYAEVAMDDVPEWNPGRISIEHVLKAAYRMKDLTRQLLVFSRMRNGGCDPVEIGSVLKQVIRESIAALPENITLREDIGEQEYPVSADEGQIREALIHLIDNAVRAMLEDGGELRIGVTGIYHEGVTDARDRNPGPFVRIRISDTGQGIAPNILEKIFDPYFTTRPVGEGKGLGLALVYGIVKRYGGAVTVCSSLGEGTTFDLLLPMSESRLLIPLTNAPSGTLSRKCKGSIKKGKTDVEGFQTERPIQPELRQGK